MANEEQREKGMSLPRTPNTKVSTITLTAEILGIVQLRYLTTVLYLKQENVSIISKGERNGRQRTCSGRY
jgi:hypothetical protein